MFSKETVDLACQWLSDDIDGAMEDDPSVGINRDEDLANLFRHIQVNLEDWLARDAEKKP